ncbi:unnamed protein product [Ixodes pacificus]
MMPCIQDVVKTMIKEEHLKKVLQIPCSNDTLGRRIHGMALDMESQVIECTRNSPKFTIAMDESCDISGRRLPFQHFLHSLQARLCPSPCFCHPPLVFFFYGSLFFFFYNCSFVVCIAICTDGAKPGLGTC